METNKIKTFFKEYPIITAIIVIGIIILIDILLNSRGLEKILDPKLWKNIIIIKKYRLGICWHNIKIYVNKIETYIGKHYYNKKILFFFDKRQI